jgi:hypothetical protein
MILVCKIIYLAHIAKKTRVDHDIIHGMCKHAIDECHDVDRLLFPLKFT